MPEYQFAEKDGSIVTVEYDKSAYFTPEQVLTSLRTAFSLFPSEVTVNQVEGYDDVFHVVYTNENTDFDEIYICAKGTTPGGRSGLKDEQRIQPKAKYLNYVFKKGEEGSKAVFLGVYVREEQMVLCTWKVAASAANSEDTPISKQIKISSIAKAIQEGFVQQDKGKGEFACAFKPEFLYFYLKNSDWLHTGPVSDLNDHVIAEGDSNDDSEYESKSESLVFNTGVETPYERNRIVFGAPGTGKSYLLKEDVKEVAKSYAGIVVERVTFHPEYSYSQFVGTYKPTMIEAEPTIHLDAEKKEILAVLRDNSLSAQEKYDLLYDKFKEEGLTRLPLLLGLYCDDSFKTKKQDGTDAVGDNSVERNHGRAIRPYVNLTEKAKGKSEIAYEYVPGPFMRMYVSALRSARNYVPQPHILIIEEINRAKVAAVFGDIFQLLDRDDEGVSEYDIQASEDIKKYLAKELGGSPEDYKRIRIPDNMFIWATMNSADQGVFPMDTAFKRRWNFEYLGIDENAEKIADIGKIILEGSDETIEWNRLRKAINAKMSSSEFKINEDKLMGPFFLSKKAIASNENGMIINKKAFIDAFKSKVIMYLYEDAVKQGKHRFFDGCPDTGKYSAVCDAFDKIGTKIFGATFREDFYDKED